MEKANRLPILRTHRKPFPTGHIFGRERAKVNHVLRCLCEQVCPKILANAVPATPLPLGLIFTRISSQRDATTKPRVAESKTRRTLGIRRHPIGKAQGFALFVPHILGRSFVPEGHGENSPVSTLGKRGPALAESRRDDSILGLFSRPSGTWIPNTSFSQRVESRTGAVAVGMGRNR